jgi:hypothetical protein
VAAPPPVLVLVLNGTVSSCVGPGIQSGSLSDTDSAHPAGNIKGVKLQVQVPWQPTQAQHLAGCIIDRGCSLGHACTAPSAAAEPGSRRSSSTASTAPPCWYKPATHAVLAGIHACAERLLGADAARDGGRSAPNGRAARNHLRGPPPTRAWTQHAGPAPLHDQEGARKPLYHCPAPRRNQAPPGCPVGHSGAGRRCCSSFEARA